MNFLDTLLGRSRPLHPNLDALFAIPAAATGLHAALDLAPTGVGAVCFQSADGQAATQARASTPP